MKEAALAAYTFCRGDAGPATSSMVKPKQIRILSVEDHPVFREGLATIISSQQDMLLVAQASNAMEAVAEFRCHRPDVTLMDLRLPGTTAPIPLSRFVGSFHKLASSC
jgi:DNA-binding NtrC family response regulator